MQAQLHHTSFPVADLERSRKFYATVLGLVEISRPDIFGLAGAWFQSGRCEVHLIQVPVGSDVGTPPGAINPAARHAAFAVPDYVEALAHLASNGLEVIGTSEAIGQMWTRDPDGHIIELIAPRA